MSNTLSFETMHLKKNWLKYATFDEILLKNVPGSIGHLMTDHNTNIKISFTIFSVIFHHEEIRHTVVFRRP